MRLYSEEQLKVRKRQGIIEIEELTNMRSLLQQQLTTAPKKEKEVLTQKINVLNEREAIVQRELVFIDAQLKQYTAVEESPSLSENTATLTYNEERAIASSEAYETYAKAVAEQNKHVAEYAALKQQLRDHQSQLEAIRKREKTADPSEKMLLSDQKSMAIENIKNTIPNSATCRLDSESGRTPIT